mgnify:CR=1 FL=1
MLRAVISFCLREPLVVAVVTAVVIGAGWYSTQHVPIDAIPNVGENQVIVLTAWPGRSPTQASSQISNPIFTPPQSKSMSPTGYSFPLMRISARTPAGQGLNHRGS